MLKVWSIAAMAMLLGGTALAQNTGPTPVPTRRDIWKAELPAGTYIVRLSAVTSVSQHQYVVDGAARVYEVNIGTSGSELVRFYYIEPNLPDPPLGQRAKDILTTRAETMAEKAGLDDAWKKVVKSYPMATHAHTVEYRLPTREALTSLFESIEKAWLDGAGGTFKP